MSRPNRSTRPGARDIVGKGPGNSDLKSHISNWAWAAFLGSSWTWCIGMFLPVLLVRELGIWGWIVFAAPNVIGAAAMGWVLKTPQASRDIVEKHGPACRAFSAVTIAFHVFFALWFVPRLVGLPIAASVFALVTIYLLATMSRPNADLVGGIVAFLVSLGMLAFFVRGTRTSIPGIGSHPTIDAAWLSPVCIFGFALCPYLDLTFHRARQQQPTLGRSHIAFGVGFGICFLAMIVFSLLYSSLLSSLLEPDWRGKVRPVFGWILATHMIIQTGFTLSVHARSLAASRLTPGGLFGLLVLTQVALFAAFATSLLPRYHNLDSGEVIYRLFMAFYGLVFPAYVWIFMVCARGPSVAALRAFLLSIVVAAPMYWLGFIEDRMVWLVPGVAVAILGGVMVWGSGHLVSPPTARQEPRPPVSHF
jgi:hypothetical protein